METNYNVEMAVICTLWAYESVNPDITNEEMFDECLDKYKAVMKYRAEGNPLADPTVSSLMLGKDLTRELLQNYGHFSEISFKHYVYHLKVLRYKQKLYRASVENEITPELLQDGLTIFNNPQDDGNLFQFSKDMGLYIKDLEDRVEKRVPTYSLGYTQLDEYTAPLKPGMFIVIKALRKTGKTNFALNLMVSVAKQGVPCLYFTSEMGCKELTERVTAITGNFNANKMRKGDVKADLPNILHRIEEETKLPISIYQSGMFDTAKISKLITEVGAKVVFIDYIQMFHVQDGVGQADGLEKIACRIKDIAMSLGVVVIGMSQVNKEGDTKHCLALEEKADQVIRITTNDDTQPEIKTYEVSVDLNRYGPTGIVSMALIRKSCLIYEYSRMSTATEENKKAVRTPYGDN